MEKELNGSLFNMCVICKIHNIIYTHKSMFQQNLPNDPHLFGKTFAAPPYRVSRWRFLEKKPRISHPNDDLVVSRPCFFAGGAGNGNCAQKLCQGWQHAPQQQSHISAINSSGPWLTFVDIWHLHGRAISNWFDSVKNKRMTHPKKANDCRAEWRRNRVPRNDKKGVRLEKVVIVFTYVTCIFVYIHTPEV